MSSHHIVREDQEPALLILNAHAISFEKIQELLEWMPTVIVAENQIETVVAWGIKVDVVVVAEATHDYWSLKLISQAPVSIISVKDGENAIDVAFQFLKSGNASAVNCLIQSEDDLAKLEGMSSFDVDCFINDVRWSWVKSGYIEKWLPKNSRLSVLPADARNEFSELASGSWLIEKDGMIHLKSTNPFWLGEDISD